MNETNVKIFTLRIYWDRGIELCGLRELISLERSTNLRVDRILTLDVSFQWNSWTVETNVPMFQLVSPSNSLRNLQADLKLNQHNDDCNAMFVLTH